MANDDRWHNSQSFENDLRQSYRDAAVSDFPSAGSIGLRMWQVREEPQFLAPPKVEATLGILDMLLSDALLWFYLLSANLADVESEPGAGSDQLQCFTGLVMRVTQDSVAIRDLIVSGYDVQARSLLRSLDEHIDATIYLGLRPEVCAEFLQTRDEKTSNQFWFKHLRGARKYNDATLIEKLSEKLKSLHDFRNAERDMLNAAHHPSYWACSVPFLVPVETSVTQQFAYGMRTEASYRTAKYLFSSLADLAILLIFLVPTIRTVIESSEESKASGLNYLKVGANHLANMQEKLLANWDAPIFSNSDELQEILKLHGEG